MSNLNNNTTQLEALLAKVNALPEAGSGGTNTSDATATAEEIFAGETAYGANGKITGTFTIEDELSEQNDLISQIVSALQGKLAYNTLYIGTDVPTNDFGVNGDIFIVQGE